MKKSIYNLIFVLILMAQINCGTSPQNQISFHENKEGIDLVFKDQIVLTRRNVIVKTEDGSVLKFPVKLLNNKIVADIGEFGRYEEDILVFEEFIKGSVTLSVSSNTPFIVQCPFEMAKTKETPYFMIPGFLYGSNNLATSDGQQPKFDYRGEVAWPNSSKFYVRADRSTHPGVITIENNIASIIGIEEDLHFSDGKAIELINADVSGKVKPTWAPGLQYNGLMLDSHHPDKDIVGFQLGYENAPSRYSWLKEEKVPRENEYLFGWIENKKGQTLICQTFYSVTDAPSIPAYGKLLESYYNELHEKPHKRSERHEAIEKIGNSIINNAWNSEAKAFVLVDGMNDYCDIAWTGGMQAAYPLLKAGRRLNNQDFVDKAIEFIDNMCETAMNEPAGLFNEEFRNGKWNVTGWWGVREDCFNFGDKPLHSAYLNGQAAYYLLKSYELEGKKNEKWLSSAKIVLETALRNQREDGALPVFFDPINGNAMDYDGFQSCWFVPALVLLHKFTGIEKYLKGAEKALVHYHGHHLNGELYNTPMDIHRGVDQEGNLAFIVACVEFHKLLNEQKYLDFAMDGLSWEFSWKFAYNTEHTNEPLKSMNWSSCGGSITSNYNVSIHQMGNLVAGEMYYLYQQTGNEYIAKRLHDTCIWGLGTYNTCDNDFGFGKVGQATEQFFYTDGLVLPWPNPWDGGIWEASLSWASACVLLSCAEDIPDKYFD